MIFSFFTTISGCGPELLLSPLAGPIQEGVVYWAEGEANKYYSESPDVIYRSTKHALAKLNVPILEDKPANNDYAILAGEKDKFHIKITVIENNMTRFSIRVNFWGNKEFAELIYKIVDNELDTIIFDDQGRPTNQ
jgi:hypothetical protein